MSNTNKQVITIKLKGMGFISMLGILFIGLKLMGYIGWSWWWVLSPIWLPIALVGLIIFIFIIIAILVAIFD